MNCMSGQVDECATTVPGACGSDIDKDEAKLIINLGFKQMAFDSNYIHMYMVDIYF